MELMQSLMGTKTFFDLLNFVINVMKYNAVYLKEDAVAGIIKYVKKKSRSGISCWESCLFVHTGNLCKSLLCGVLGL